MEMIVGIDLGTTNSEIAILRGDVKASLSCPPAWVLIPQAS